MPWKLAVVTCGAGVFIAAVWFLIQWRAIVNIERLEKTAAKLERQVLQSDAAKYGLSPEVNTEDRAQDRPRLTARRVVPVCIIIVGLAWLIGLSLSLFCLPAA